MTLYYGTWKIMDTVRVPCMTYFASMSAADDAKKALVLNCIEDIVSIYRPYFYTSKRKKNCIVMLLRLTTM